MKKSLIVLHKIPLILTFKNVCIALIILSVCISCDQLTTKATSKENPEEITEVETSSTDNIHVAFAGGGWRAHTAHTAWTMSLLGNNGNKLDTVFEHVESIGSNSGGSWFSTMLMYSPKFVTDIEKPGALDTWGNTSSDGGWLGGQQKLFDAANSTIYECHKLSGDAFAACVFKYYGNATEWDKIVENIVFKDYPLNSQTLNSPHQKWAINKPLLLAGSLLTNNVVLNRSYDGIIDRTYYENYYQMCLSSKVELNGKDGGKCQGNPTSADVTPVTFSSTPTSSGMTAPPFLSASSSEFNIGYSQTLSDPKKETKSIKKSLTTDDIPVVIAAATSSAALGFAASKNISGDWYESYVAEDLALNFSLLNPSVQYTGVDGKPFDYLVKNHIVRIADGGAADNSGVAQLIPFLQQNEKASDFNIVAFDNVQGPPFLTGVNGAQAGSDIALLFGKGLCIDNKFCSGFNCDGVCITVPELQIFEETSLNSPVTWSYPSKNEPIKYKNTPKLIYTKYKVTTTANSNFGIKAGSTGYLHAFTCYYPDAATIPQDNTIDGSFKAYNNMMHFINNGLKANNNEGLTYLEKAMGIK